MKLNIKKQSGLKTARRLLILQCVLTLLITLIVGLTFDQRTAVSVLLGGIVCIIPNAYFARIAFKHHGARAAKKIVNSFYKAEAVKLILTISLFAAVFINYTVVPLAFFLTYILVQLLHWLAPWVLTNKRNRPESE